MIMDMTTTADNCNRCNITHTVWCRFLAFWPTCSKDHHRNHLAVCFHSRRPSCGRPGADSDYDGAEYLYNHPLRQRRREHDNSRRSPNPAHKIYSMSLGPKDSHDTDESPWRTKQLDKITFTTITQHYIT